MVAIGPSIRSSAGSSGSGDVAASGIAMSSFRAEHLNSTSNGVTIPVGVVQNAADRPRMRQKAGDGSRHGERADHPEPSGIVGRSVLARLPARPLSVSSGAARGRAGGLARAIRHMDDGPPRTGPRRPDRSCDLLFVGRRRLERLPQGTAMASAEHHPGGRPAAAHPHPRGADADTVAGCDQGSCAKRSSAKRRLWLRGWSKAANSTASPISPRPIP